MYHFHGEILQNFNITSNTEIIGTELLIFVCFRYKTFAVSWDATECLISIKMCCKFFNFTENINI